MATQAFKNNAGTVFASTTAGILPVGGLSFTVTTGGGAKFPAVSGGDYFYVTLFEKDGSDVEENYEVVKCTGVSGDTITISERDIDSLVGVAGGRAYPTVGGRTVYVQMRVTAGTLANFSQKTATETLSNKTFSTPVLIPDGSAAAPAIAFADDTDTGVYSSAANKVAVSLGGVKKAEFSGSDLLMDSAAVATPSSISLINPSKQMYLYSGSTVSSPSISVNSGSPYCSITFNYGQIAVQSIGGSESTPTYSFSLDTNTGMYSPGADQIGIATSGTLRWLVDANGNVGVGVTPDNTCRQEIYTTGSTPLKITTNTSGNDNCQLRFKSISGDRWAIGNNVATGGIGVNFDIYDLVSGANRLRIDSSGNVGIGRAPAAKKFEVAGQTFVQDATQPATFWGNTLGDYLGAHYTPSTKEGVIAFDGTGTTFAIKNNGANRLVIDSSGNIIQNVNTSAPALSTNQQMVFSLTSNTNLRISVRGTDGTTRVANITLA